MLEKKLIKLSSQNVIGMFTSNVDVDNKETLIEDKGARWDELLFLRHSRGHSMRY